MLEHYRDDQRLFGLLRYASIMRSKHLNPFGRSVVGVFTSEPYTVRVRVWGGLFLCIKISSSCTAAYWRQNTLSRVTRLVV